MANTTKPLTNTEVKQAKPKEKEYNLSDGGGLALRIKPSGSKLWIFNYSRPFTKKRANIGLGSYPALSLADARSQKEEFRALLAKKIDPKEYRDEQKEKSEEAYANSLEHLTSLWLETKSNHITEDHKARIYRSLELHIFPTLGKMPVHKIKAKKAIEVMRPLAERGILDTVRRLCQRLNEIMTYAVNTGILDTNCLTGIAKAFPPPKVTNNPTIRPEELPELMRDIQNANIKVQTRNLIHWQLHTMVRPGEAAGARWEEIDFDESTWRIPGKRMKEGRDHVVPLTNQALEVLENMKPFSANREFIFPAHIHPKKHMNSETANMALKRMGYKDRQTAHGLRALASTTLNEQGFDADVIESALAHVDKNNVRRVYNRAEYLEPRKELMSWWSGYIDKATSYIIS